MKPNILLVVFDTARADAFEPYGAPAGSSPVVADMAREGGHVPRAYAPASWTVPSHVGMFTGRLARSVGLGQAPDGNYRGTRPRLERLREDLLPEVLRKEGYVTAGASCNAWISPTGGWDLGFDSFNHVPSPRTVPRGRFSRSTARWLRELVVAEIDDGAREVEQSMIRWFQDWDASQPFFWFVNLVECHGPYLPPVPYNDLSWPQRILAGRDCRHYQSFEAVFRQNLTGIEASEAKLARMRHLYALSIRVLDDWLDRILGLLSGHGVLDDTAVVVTSDHGENFGEGGLIGHSMSLDERLTRVPVVARGPVELPADGAWSLLGLPAMIAETAGMSSSPYEPWPVGRPAPAQFDPLATHEDERVEQLRDDWSLGADQVSRLTDPLTMVTDGTGKLVARGDQSWFHDLSSDPLELNPQPSDRASAQLREAMEARDLWIDDVLGDVDDAAEQRPSSSDEITKLEEQMKLLGYM